MTKKSVPAIKKDNLPATTEFEEFAGEGMENIGANDILIPRLGILQSLSPQLKKAKAEHIEGAEEGDIADLGTGDLFPDGVLFLPVYYRKDYLEWAPRSTGKGLIDIHSSPSILDQCTKGEKNEMVLPNGNLIVETAQFYGFNLSVDSPRKCFIPMSSTQLKKARKLNTLTTGEKLARADGSKFTAPMWYRTYMLTTAEESNNDGEWAGWVINRGDSLPEVDEAILGGSWQTMNQECKDFLDSIIKGEARMDTSSMDSEAKPNSTDADDGEEM